MPFKPEVMNSFYAVYNNLERNSLDKNRLLSSYNPISFLAKSSNDTPRFHESMNGPLADYFYKAMQAEMETLDKIDPWEVVPREEAGESNILDSKWEFKTKKIP